MVQMDVLPSMDFNCQCIVLLTTYPERRYASFKLYYTDDTPAEYEPPHFKAGDYERDKWHFMTHDFEEAPDKWSVGRLKSGYHSCVCFLSSVVAQPQSSSQRRSQYQLYRYIPTFVD